MSNIIDLAWVDSRVSAILRAPRMWGSRDAVESLILLLCEMRIAISRGDKIISEDIVKLYALWLFDNNGLNQYLSLFKLDCMPESRFVELLSKFYEYVKTELS